MLATCKDRRPCSERTSMRSRQTQDMVKEMEGDEARGALEEKMSEDVMEEHHIQQELRDFRVHFRVFAKNDGSKNPAVPLVGVVFWQLADVSSLVSHLIPFHRLYFHGSRSCLHGSRFVFMAHGLSLNWETHVFLRGNWSC